MSLLNEVQSRLKDTYMALNAAKDDLVPGQRLLDLRSQHRELHLGEYLRFGFIQYLFDLTDRRTKSFGVLLSNNDRNLEFLAASGKEGRAFRNGIKFIDGVSKPFLNIADEKRASVNCQATAFHGGRGGEE